MTCGTDLDGADHLSVGRPRGGSSMIWDVVRPISGWVARPGIVINSHTLTHTSRLRGLLAGRLSRPRWVTRRTITNMQKLQYLDALGLVGQGSQGF